MYSNYLTITMWWNAIFHYTLAKVCNKFKTLVKPGAHLDSRDYFLLAQYMHMCLPPYGYKLYSHDIEPVYEV